MTAFERKVEEIVAAGAKKLEAAVAHAEKYPMCTKVSAVRNDKAIIQSFLEWLEEENLVIHDCDGAYPLSDEQLLMEYFGIDAAQLEKERRKILTEQRKLNERKP